MRTRLAAALIAAIAAVLPHAALSADAMGTLRQAVSAGKHSSYVGQVQVLRFGQQHSDAAVYRIEHRAPDMTRRWYVAPQDVFGDSTITRGSMTYSVDVKHNRVIASSGATADEQVARDDNFDLLASNYHATAEADDQIAGRAAHVILLSNKYTGQATMRVYVDAETNLVLEKQEYAGNGSLISQFRFEQIRYTNDIPQAIFAIPNLPQVQESPRTTTTDIARVVSAAGFKTVNPRYLPEGFFSVAGDVNDVKGVRTVHLLYSDGIRTFSLFENEASSAIDLSHYQVHSTKVENNDANYVEDGPNTLLTWSRNDLHFALVGDLSLNELRKIAGSVNPG